MKQITVKKKSKIQEKKKENTLSTKKTTKKKESFTFREISINFTFNHLW